MRRGFFCDFHATKFSAPPNRMAETLGNCWGDAKSQKLRIKDEIYQLERH
jgi:hypothetical protein